jgi:hypothetical protein
MRQRSQRIPRDSTLVSSSELAEIIGVGIETINNWIRHDIISRVRGGGRQLRARLFSTDEVYKAALTNELVRLGIGPSSASEAANVVWKEWEKKDVTEGQKVYAVVVPTEDKWVAVLRLQGTSVGSLYKVGRQSVEVALPKHAFAVIPISDIFEYVSRKMSAQLG